MRSSQSGLLQSPRNGERDPARLHEQALIPFGIEDMSMLVVSVGDPSVPAYASVTLGSVIIESPVPPTRAFFLFGRPVGGLFRFS